MKKLVLVYVILLLGTVQSVCGMSELPSEIVGLILGKTVDIYKSSGKKYGALGCVNKQWHEYFRDKWYEKFLGYGLNKRATLLIEAIEALVHESRVSFAILEWLLKTENAIIHQPVYIKKILPYIPYPGSTGADDHYTVSITTSPWLVVEKLGEKGSEIKKLLQEYIPVMPSIIMRDTTTD